MEKKNNRNSHIMMNKGMKQKVSVLLIACLLLTGYHGLTISGKAEQASKSESNEISVSGTEVRVQLLGEDLRRAAREAIEKGTKVEGSFPEGYSGDGELQKEYEAIFSPEKEVYEIPLDSISEGLSESLSEEEAGLQIFVERDAKDLESLVRKESTESLLLYDGSSQLAQLFPERKKEEKQNKTEKAKELTEGVVASSSDIEETAVASDSNIERRNTELTGSELITFLYKNKSEHKISFKLSVDGNQYPKLVVAPKTQLFKGLLEKLKKEEKKAPAEVKPAEKQEEKPAESEEEQAKEEPVKAESSEEKKQLAEENAPVEEKKELSEKEEKPISEVSIVSTEGKAEEAQPEAKEVEEKTEKSEERKEDKVETAEAESKEESAEKGVEAEKDGAKSAEAEKEAANTEKQADEKGRFEGFLQEVLDHYEEFLAELSSARFRRYSLNELGRKTQNVEIKDFATVEVFYDEDAFADEEGNTQEVVLKANRLLKPEEAEKEGEKLTEKQVEAMKEHSIYEGSDALDIRFVSKEDETKEVEPKNPVSVRLTFDKKAVPEEANADSVAIHHLLESKENGEIELVETVLRSEKEKKADEKKNFSEDERNPEEIEGLSLDKGEEKDESKLTDKITKEFTVTSFSPFVVKWNDYKTKAYHGIRIYYVDRNGREIGPTRYYRLTDSGKKINEIKVTEEQANAGTDASHVFYHVDRTSTEEVKPIIKIEDVIDYKPNGYLRWGLFGISKSTVGALYNGAGYQAQITKLTANYVEYLYNGDWRRNWFSDICEFTDFVFVYYLCGDAENEPKPDDTTPDLKNEKYITDNLDGTYDLTLTGQSVVSGKTNKKPLDIVFVYDNTAIMSTDFGFDGTKNNTEEYSGIQGEEKKSTKVKKELRSFMEKMSSPDSAYDTRYALVTMDGMKEHQYDLQYREKYTDSYMTGKMVKDVDEYGREYEYRKYEDNDYPDFAYAKGIEDTKKGKFVGEFQGLDEKLRQVWLEKAQDDRKKKVNGKDVFVGFRQRSADFTIVDNVEDDTAYVHGFTSRPNDILSYLENLQEGKTTVTKLSGSKYSEKISGENYTAAIRNVRALLQKDISIKANREESTQYKARDDAKKIVVFIAGGDPKYAYIQKPYKYSNGYQYDDILRFKDQTDGIQYYRTRALYEEGYSIGNGRSIDFPALNQARGELHQITKIDAFYSIGVGNENNWNHLNDFAMGQWYDKNFESLFEGKADLRENALVKGTLYKCFDGSEASKLNKSFDEIYKRVAVDSVQNIVIRDVLTKNVQPIMKDGKPDVIGQLVKMKPNGNKQAVEVDKVLERNDMKKLGLDGFTIEAKKVSASETGIQGQNYDGERWLLTLKTIPEDFALPAGYDIRMVAKIEATTDAKKNASFANQGEARTDLNAIYKEYLGREYHGKTGQPDEMFNSSTGKFGLFTNEVADISYKTRNPDGSQKTPPPKKYNKPIIRMGNLLFEKTFVGIEEKDFFKASSGFTELGKKVLKQINFKVFREKKGVEEFLLTINLGDEEIIKNLGKGPFEYHGYILEFTKGTGTQVSITMKGMPLNRVYRVQEELLDPEKELRESETATSGYKFDKKLHDPERTEAQHLIADSMNYHFKNKYVPVQTPKKTVTIKKVVKGKSTANEQFDFYMVLYNGDSPYGLVDTNTIVSAQVKATTDKIESVGKIKVKEPIDSGTEKEFQAIHFTLEHDQSVAFTMDTNVNFKLFELKKDGYDKAKIIGTLDENFAEEKLAEVNGKSSSYTAILSNMGQTFTVINPKKMSPPTGLHRELAPYLISIFGFVAMAGLYFGINEKRRREI